MTTPTRIHPERTLLRIDARSLHQLNLQRQARGERRLHQCTVCGLAGEWGPGWSRYGSLRDEDDDTEAKFCSTACREREPIDTTLARARRFQYGQDQ